MPGDADQQEFPSARLTTRWKRFHHGLHLCGHVPHHLRHRPHPWPQGSLYGGARDPWDRRDGGKSLSIPLPLLSSLPPPPFSTLSRSLPPSLSRSIPNPPSHSREKRATTLSSSRAISTTRTSTTSFSRSVPRSSSSVRFRVRRRGSRRGRRRFEGGFAWDRLGLIMAAVCFAWDERVTRGEIDAAVVVKGGKAIE